MFKNIELGNNQDEVWLFGDKVLYLRQISNRTHTQRCIMAKQLYIDFDEYIRQGEHPCKLTVKGDGLYNLMMRKEGEE